MGIKNIDDIHPMAWGLCIWLESSIVLQSRLTTYSTSQLECNNGNLNLWLLSIVHDHRARDSPDHHWPKRHDFQVLQENQPPFHCLDIPSPIAANFISLNPSWRFLSSIQLLLLKPPCPFFHQYLCIRARGIHQGPAGTGHNGRTQEEEKGVADG